VEIHLVNHVNLIDCFISPLKLLDHSAAFHTNDHNILLNSLKNCVAISGIVLAWFKSYLSDHCSSKWGDVLL